MQLPSLSPAPQSSRAQSRFCMLGLSGRASLPALGTSCGSGIPIEELFTQEGLQEQFAKDSTHRSPPNSRSDPNPLAGGSLWGHTKDRAPGRSGSRSVVCTGQEASRGHLGTPKARGEKATLDPAEGKGRRQRAVQGARWARKRQIESLSVVFHCTHIITHTLC